MHDTSHDDLISRLTDRLLPVRRLPAPWVRASLWILLWAAMAATMVALHGNATLLAKLQDGREAIWGFIGAVATASTAVLAAFMLSVPGRSARWALLPLPGLALWISANGLGCLEDLAIPGIMDPPPQACFKMILLLATPLSIVLLIMLRRAFNMHPHLTATMAGLAAAAAAAVVLDLVHPVGTTASDAMAHAAAVLLVVAVNRVLTVRALAPMAIVMVALTAHPAPAYAAPSRSAKQADRPVVVELFTSQGCSSCPPADDILNELAQTRKDVFPLSLHVEYWNRLGWVDPFSSPEMTERQRVYASRATDPTLFTPEMVIDGARSVVGSDPDQIDAAIDAAEDEVVSLATVALKVSPADIVVTVGAGTGRAGVVLVGYDRSHTTPVGRGENGGRTLTEMNVVRSIQPIGDWTGAELTLRQKRPAGQLFAVLLAAPNGRIVGLTVPGR